MLNLFRALVDRLKAALASVAARELEAELALRDAASQAELLRQAQRYDAEGLPAVAAGLRRQAQRLAHDRAPAEHLPAGEGPQLAPAPPAPRGGNGRLAAAPPKPSRRNGR